MVLLPEGLHALKQVAKEAGLDLRGAYFNLDGGFDSTRNRKIIFNAGMIPNIKENSRNRKRPKRGRKRLFNATIHALRLRVERTFAWEDKFKRLLLRFERIQQRHYGMKVMAYTLINLRAFCGISNSQPVHYQHVSRVPTCWQRALGTAPLVAAHRPISLLLCQGVRAHSSMPHALARCLLCSEGMCAPGLCRSLQSPGRHGARASPTRGTRCALQCKKEALRTVPPSTPHAVPAHRVLRQRQPLYPRGGLLGQGVMVCHL
jgi:hypothetical protein